MVLSGVVLGMVYGPRLVRDGWQVVLQAVSPRIDAVVVKVSWFVAVTLSILAVARGRRHQLGDDVGSGSGDVVLRSAQHEPRRTCATRVAAFGPWAFGSSVSTSGLSLLARILILLRRVGWRAAGP